MGQHSATGGQRTVSSGLTQHPLETRIKEYASNLSKTQETASQREEILNLAKEAILIVNEEGNLIFWNRGAERLYGWSEAEVLGKSPTEILKTDLPRTIPQIENILRQESYWDCELKQTTRDGNRITVSSRWSLYRDKAGVVCGRFQLDTDITKRKQIENELRVLSGRLLTLRDEERRRLARDLHDSVGQLLAGATMNLSLVQHQLEKTNPECLKLMEDLGGLLEQSVKEIRTLSYLLHPPLLDEVGLPSALQWYISGFAERSQIKVQLEIPENLGRFSRELELALFRIVQESLTNVHRHSGSSSAKIALCRLPGQLRLKVEDQGKGMSLPIAGSNPERVGLGVGISGMRERVRQMGGQIQVRSGAWGTAVEVLFPLESSSTDCS